LLADTSKVLEVTMNKRDGLKISYPSALMAAIAAIIIFCIISVIFNAIPLDALPTNFIGAILGALIGALITLVLLRGQTDIEEKKGKDIRILEKKTQVFQSFINSVMKKYQDIKLTLKLNRVSKNYIIMNFFADQKIQQLDQFRYVKKYRELIGGDTNANAPIPNDEDKTYIPENALDFSDEAAMEFFRKEKRNFPDILSKRVLYHLGEWKIDGLGYIEFFEEYLGREHLQKREEVK
jgi:hypothetical protein